MQARKVLEEDCCSIIIQIGGLEITVGQQMIMVLKKEKELQELQQTTMVWEEDIAKEHR